MVCCCRRKQLRSVDWEQLRIFCGKQRFRGLVWGDAKGGCLLGDIDALFHFQVHRAWQCLFFILTCQNTWLSRSPVKTITNQAASQNRRPLTNMRPSLRQPLHQFQNARFTTGRMSTSVCRLDRSVLLSTNLQGKLHQARLIVLNLYVVRELHVRCIVGRPILLLEVLRWNSADVGLQLAVDCGFGMSALDRGKVSNQLNSAVSLYVLPNGWGGAVAAPDSRSVCMTVRASPVGIAVPGQTELNAIFSFFSRTNSSSC